MYQLLLVDDERLEKEGIRDLLSWMDLDVEVAGEASSGKKALELAERLEPDIVMTDIKMPGMSGIELASQVKTMLPDVKIIFITGYQDFEYAKDAISLGAYGYILKPVDEEELYAVMKKAINQFESERHSMEEKQALTRQIEESLPFLQQQILRSLFLDSADLTNEFLAQIEKSGIFSKGKSYRVIVMSLDNFPIYEREHPREQTSSLAQSTLHHLNAVANGTCCISAVQTADDLFCFPSAETDEEKLGNDLKCVMKWLEQNYGMTVTVGISMATSSYFKLHKLYGQALEATKSKWYIGPGKMIWAAGLPQAAKDSKAGLEIDLSHTDLKANVIKYILSGDEYAIGIYLEEYFDKLPEGIKNSRKQFQGLCLKILEACEHLLTERNESFSDVFGDRVSILDELLIFDTYYGLKTWVIYKIMELSAYMSRKNTDRSNRVAEKVIRIINDCYDQDITIEMIAKKVYLSPNYIRRIFKSETGQTILQYMTRVRLEKAVELMKDPSLKISDISQKVGYGSVSYFGQIFKQYYGVSPKEYMETMDNL
jgi:YesN/AraC family two-component response regulator